MSRKFGNGGNPKSGYWVQVKNLEIFFGKLRPARNHRTLYPLLLSGAIVLLFNSTLGQSLISLVHKTILKDPLY